MVPGATSSRFAEDLEQVLEPNQPEDLPSDDESANKELLGTS